MKNIIKTAFVLLILCSIFLSCSQAQVKKEVVPASFKTSDLIVRPSEVKPGDPVTILVDVTNVGGESGTYSAKLKINGAIDTSQDVIIEAGSSKNIAFDVIAKLPGNYTVTIDSLEGKFTVAELEAEEKPEIISRTLTDADFNKIAHMITGTPAFDYSVHFINDNKLFVTSSNNFTFDVGVCDGKLCFNKVDLIAWQYIFQVADKYMSYDSGLMTIYALPDEALKAMFGTDIKSLPDIKSVTTSDNKMVISFSKAD